MKDAAEERFSDRMRRLISILALFLVCFSSAFAQSDRREVRSGNRDFRKGKYREAEIDYRKAVLKDSLSVAGQYNLASSLYRSGDYDAASKALEAVKEPASASENAARYHFNSGDVALQKKDYSAAVESFKQALLLDPSDLEAKENYIYAKKMLQNQQNGQGGGSDNQNQDQDQNQDQNQDQDQNQNQNQDNNQDQQDNQDQQRQSEPQMSDKQAQQMLKAIQAKEKETQDKVNKEKAALLKSRQKEKNW